MSKCIYCNKEIVLIPSAKERARTYGSKPLDYTKLFEYHLECFIKKYEKDTSSLISRLNRLSN